MYAEKTDNFWKVVGCFWALQKGVFFLFFFRTNVFVVCFCVFGKVAKVLKMFVVFHCLILGWHSLVYLGLEGLGVFVFLVFVFLLFRLWFFIFALFLFCCWIVIGVVPVFVFGVSSVFFFSVLCLFVCFCLFCFVCVGVFCYFSLIISFWLVYVLFFVFLGVV